uniref:Uncharacterized protein n=1 Tax=Anguilla anguilla TaxID=7936 RepID=A0A0E9QGQ4_ANGAN
MMAGQGKSEEEFLDVINDLFWHSMSISLQEGNQFWIWCYVKGDTGVI